MSRKLASHILKGSIATSAGQLATIGFHFLTIMVMTRVLPKEDFGFYILMLVVVDSLKIFSSLGLDLTLVKFISRKDIDHRSAFWGIILLRSAFMVVIGAVFLLFAGILLPFLEVRLTEFTPYLLAIGFLASFRELLFFLQQGLRQFKNYAVLQVSSAGIKFLALLIFLATIRLGIRELIWIELITYLLSILMQLCYVPRSYFHAPHWTRDTLQALLKFGLPLYANNILAFAQGRINLVMIATLLNPISVAYYGVAKKLPEAMARMFKSFVVVFFPNLAHCFSEGKKTAAEKMLNQSLVTLGTLLSVVVLGVFLFRDQLVLLIFSEKYLPASLGVALLIVNFCFHAISSLMGYALVSAGKPAIPAKVNAVTNIANLGLSFGLILQFDFMGPIYSMLLLKGSSQFAYGHYLRQIGIGIHHKRYLAPLIVALLFGGVENWLSWHSILFKLSILVTYSILCWFLFREFRQVAGHIVQLGFRYWPFKKKSDYSAAA